LVHLLTYCFQYRSPLNFSLVDSLFFSAYHTSISIFLICRPWKFAALGPGPGGPCVNTGLIAVVTTTCGRYDNVRPSLYKTTKGWLHVVHKMSNYMGSRLHQCQSNSGFHRALLQSITFIRPVPVAARSRSFAARLLGLWVRIPPGARMFVCCECCMLSRRGLCDGLIILSEESYRLWRVVVCDQETS